MIIIYFLQEQMLFCCGDCWVDSDDQGFRKKGINNSPKKTTIQSQIVPNIQTPPTQNVVQSFQKPDSATFSSFPQIRSLGLNHPSHTLRDQSTEDAPYAIMKEPKFIEKPLQESFADEIQEGVVEKDEHLNAKFDNSVRDSVVSNHMPEQQVDYEQLLDNGLPNIGNTCYLNSVLQMLYSADKFREVVVRLSVKPQLEFHQLLARVFLHIKERSSMDKKRQSLINLVQYIQKRQAQFVRYSQNDALESLLCVLNMLEEQYPACSKLNYFKVKYQMRCGCKISDATIENYCVKSNQFCLRCKSSVSYLIQNTGPYLIILPNAQNYRFKRFIKFVNKDNNHIYYQQKSLITHFGTRDSGHYISHRRVDKKWIRISDSTVRIADNLAKHCEVPKITLYQFQKKRME